MADECIDEERREFLGVSAVALSGAVVAGTILPSVTPATAETRDEEISVLRVGSQPSTAGAPTNFTGAVRVDSRFQRAEPARIGGGFVNFEPGARTAWHAHPLGQTLIVTCGVGLVQAWDGAIQEIKPGDVVWIPPGIKHWHGATPTNGMTHIALAEAIDGKTVEWMEQVSDEQYRRR